MITSRDIALIRESRSRNKYSDFSDDQRGAYQRVHAALEQLGTFVINELGGSRHYVLKLTSGFHPVGGVRGSKPKDLWFGIYRRENERPFVGNPQLFMIVSERGVEYGFSPLTHPDDFSNQEIKKRVRQIASTVLAKLPAAGSPESHELNAALSQTGPWYFRRKQRIDPKHSEYASLDQWLNFLRSPAGAQNAGGGITQYLSVDEIDGANLEARLREMAQTFRPLMESIIAGSDRDAPMKLEGENSDLQPTDDETYEFATALKDFLREFAAARTQPFGKVPSLWTASNTLKGRLENTPAVRRRSLVSINVSVGQGNWASVPWIALMNSKVTQSTQEGIYVAFLIAKDLKHVFLTLNQGTTKLIRELGQTGAQARMTSVAQSAREHIGDLLGGSYHLDSDFNLEATGWLARNYEVGTIAHTDLDVNNLPSDREIDSLLERVLSAYDYVIDTPELPAPVHGSSATTVLEDAPSAPDPYTIDTALQDIFVDRATLERLMALWRGKKNLILQGAPGVGKSFAAKRLAYLLLGAKDAGRVATIQFHQSYSYEDFVQGYRPDGRGGFELRNGVFHRFCEKADRSPALPHVFIIDEINRGNLSKILGELMLLVEHDKRGPGWATTLTYSRDGEAPFFVPENVFILGLMNTADRSLSMVDYALRRRFSFVTLEPMFTSPKFEDFLGERGVPREIVAMIVDRMNVLNRTIGEDRANLGPGYRIGHSFFVPPDDFVYDPGWYRRVVETEIFPLLEEYWFDDPDKALDWQKNLLDGAS